MYIALTLILALLVILFISIAKVYRSVPLIELKRRARNGHEPAKSIYRVAGYKRSSQFLLLFLASIASAGFFILSTLRSPIWVAFIVDVTLIWLAYIWVPRSPVNVISQWFAQVLAKPLAWLLQYIHPIINSFSKKKTKPKHTGIYENSDIVRLLSAQQKQNDNRVDDFELELLKRVVDFADKKVLDVMTPKRKVYGVSIEDTLGPIVLSELHKTKHSYFPVYDGKEENIIGVLSIVSLTGIKRSVSVSEAMSPVVYYINEEQTLGQVLRVVNRTAQELFVVINSDQEYTGIVTAREVLKELVGETITEEFDQYDNRELVSSIFSGGAKELNLAEDTTELVE